MSDIKRNSEWFVKALRSIIDYACGLDGLTVERVAELMRNEVDIILKK